MSSVSLTRIRFGVRVAAVVVALASLAGGGYGIGVAHVDAATVLDGLAFVAVVAIGWAVIEAVVAGFEEIKATTRERYEQLERQRPDAYAIVAHAVMAMESKRCAEDPDKVRVLHNR
jgi:hypothetical protein